MWRIRPITRPCAALGRAPLARRGVGAPSAPSIRTSSETTSASASSTTMALVGSAEVSLTIVKWRSASEAIWGRWVMHSTWPRSSELRAGARRRRARSDRRCPRRPRRRPDRRPVPACAILVEAAIGGAPSLHADREHHARELSAGGDLTQRPGRDPGLGAIMNSTASAPVEPGPAREISTSKRGLAHRQRRQLLAHREREWPGLGGRARAAPARARRASRRASPRRLGDRSAALSAPDSSSPARSRAAACSSTASIAPSVLGASAARAPRAALRSPGGSPSSPSSPPRARRSDGAPSREVLGLDHERAAARWRARPGRRRLPRARRAERRRRPPAGRRRAARSLRGERLGAGAGGTAQASSLRRRSRGAAARRARGPTGRGASISASSYSSRSSSRSRAPESSCSAFELGLERRAPRASVRAAASRRAQMLCAAELVEDLQLGRGEREPAVLVLAVEGDRAHRRSRAAPRPWRERPFRIGARAPVRAHPTGEHELLGALGAGSAELGELARAGSLGERERPLDVGLAGAGAHDPRPRTPSEQQVERVGEHGLARARLPGEYVQPRREAQLGPLDQQQVLDAKLAQHRAGLAARADGSARTEITAGRAHDLGTGNASRLETVGRRDLVHSSLWHGCPRPSSAFQCT